MENEKHAFRAYYFTLDATGVPEVDLILENMAKAGKAFHHTSEWDDDDCREYNNGLTYIESIQNAANACAAAWNTRASDNRRCEDCKSWQRNPAEHTALGRCANTGSYQGADWFCADFTKREE